MTGTFGRSSYEERRRKYRRKEKRMNFLAGLAWFLGFAGSLIGLVLLSLFLGNQFQNHDVGLVVKIVGCFFSVGISFSVATVMALIVKVFE